MPKRIVPLSPLQVNNAKPKGKQYKISDGGGLYLLVTPSGGKLWRLKYRFQGREKKLALGAFPEVSLAAARHKRDEAKKLLAEDIDPGIARKKKKEQEIQQQTTFQQVAEEWHQRFQAKWAPKTAKAIWRMLERDVLEEFGGLPIGDIDPPMVLKMLRRIEARGANYTAHRVKGICSQIFCYGVSTGRINQDPSASLKGALAPIKTTHRAATTDPKELAPLLRMLDSYTGSKIVQCALSMLPFVFVRPGELRTMLWEDVDLEKGEWSYLVNKTKTRHMVPLARQAIAILKEMIPISGDSPYVFPSARTNTRPMSNMAMNAAMRRMGIDTKTEITSHGFRAVARTLLDEELGYRPDYIEHQLAHSVRDPLGRAYNRTSHLAERRKMMQAWADYVDKLKAGAVIVPIRAAQQ